MPDKPRPPPRSQTRWNYWWLTLVCVLYAPPLAYVLALMRHDGSLFLAIWVLTAMGYLSGVVWVIREVGLYDPPVNDWLALWIQVAGLAPWPLLWTTSGQFEDFSRRAAVAPIIWLWAVAAHWLSRTSHPGRRRRTIRAFLLISGAIVLVDAAFALRAVAPGLGLLVFAPAAALALFGAYDFATRPSPPVTGEAG